jgi:hypothetical protein
MKRNFEYFNFPALQRLPDADLIECINQKKQKTGFDQSFLNDSSYLYSYPIKIPKPENHTSERNQYSLNKLVQIYQNSDGKYVDANKKIIKNEDVYMVSSPDNDTDSMTVYFFKLDEIIHYRKNHEKSSDGISAGPRRACSYADPLESGATKERMISCRFSLGFIDGEKINQINLIDVLDKNCFYKNACDRYVPYTSLYKILCIKTGKEYLMTSSLSGGKNDAMLSVGLPYDHPFCIGIDRDVVLNSDNKNGKRKRIEFNPFPETILPPVFSESLFIDGVFR